MAGRYCLYSGSNGIFFQSNVLWHSKDIQTVSGNGKAAFVRKQAKKVADLIYKFKKVLQEHNINNSELWNKIESNTLGLFENSFAQQENCKKEIINYVKSIYQIKEPMKQARDNFNVVLTNMLQLKNLERSLTQTINYIEDDFKSFDNWTYQVDNGIDRIIDKSKVLVGEIDFMESSILKPIE